MRDIRQKAVDENVIGDSLVQRFRPSWRIILFSSSRKSSSKVKRYQCGVFYPQCSR